MRTARIDLAVVLWALVLNASFASAQELTQDEERLHQPAETPDAADGDTQQGLPAEQPNTLRLSGEFVGLGDSNFYLRGAGSYARQLPGALEAFEVGFDGTLLVGNGAVGGDYEGPRFGPRLVYARTAFTLRFHDRFRVRAVFGLGAVGAGITVGGGGYAIIGAPLATHVEVGGEHMLDVGFVARARVGFNVHPRMAMGVSVEATTFPVDSHVSARVLLDAIHRFDSGMQLRWQLGYRSFPDTRGGVSTGFEMARSF